MDAKRESSSVTTSRAPNEPEPHLLGRRLVLVGVVVMLAGCAVSRSNPTPTAWEPSAECAKTGGRWFVDTSGARTCLYPGR